MSTIEHNDHTEPYAVDMGEHYPPLAMAGPNQVLQIGAHDQCGRRECRVSAVSWRVILGHWRVQVYTCTPHLAWACSLDLLTENTGKGYGFTQVPVISGSRTMVATQVIAELSQIMRVDYVRDPMVGEVFPQTVVSEAGELRHRWKAYGPEM